MDSPEQLEKCGHYIQLNFITDHCGIDLSSLGNKVYERIFPVDLSTKELLDRQELKNRLNKIIAFVNKVYSGGSKKPVWHRLNLIDQAFNEYVGMGFLDTKGDWLGWILDSLSNGRAEQSGDTFMTIFDLNFNWAVGFTLDQRNSRLIVEKHEKVAGNVPHWRKS